MAKKSTEEKGKSPRDIFMESIKKSFGKDSPIVDTSDEKALLIEKFPSGSLLLDEQLKGGWPKGKIIELFGPEESGKTTTAIHAVAEFLKKYPDESALWLDQEKVFDPVYFETIGIDWKSDRFILSRAHSGENAYEIMLNFMKAFEGGIIIVDSVATLLPEAEDEKDMGAATMGSQARLNSQGLRKLMPYLNKSGTTLIFINQVRDKIGDTWNPEETPGGKAIRFYSRTRVRVNKLKSDNDASAKAQFHLIKSNYGNVGAKVQTYINYGEGYDRLSEIIQLGLEYGVLELKGSWYSYEGDNVAQGANKLMEILRDENNAELLNEIEQKVIAHVEA